MNFCSQCAHPLVFQIPHGDDRPRYLCEACGAIHYQNPRIIAGTLPVWQDQVLLCKRAIHPRLGYWTLPAGFMENGETLREAAARETWEEAHAKVEVGEIYTLTSIPHINQVQILYLANLSAPEYSAGPESLEVELFREEQIPWNELAFPTIRNALRFYFADRRQGHFPLRHVDFDRS
ncbi:NUDIX hydrolase [Balneatrix alpica]|uniref:NUDIX hydrolase n=1 Tax=Balneatrix alpica TaxID=75684 RepID=A0ABV5Z970_9GAMM|nr:NUDIX hydrolase [Balneatrix alpica]